VLGLEVVVTGNDRVLLDTDEVTLVVNLVVGNLKSMSSNPISFSNESFVVSGCTDDVVSYPFGYILTLFRPTVDGVDGNLLVIETVVLALGLSVTSCGSLI
jgi:hypothetical protein